MASSCGADEDLLLFSSFLAFEWEKSFPDKPEYDISKVKPLYVKAPRQENSFDCGVYILKFADIILKSYLKLLHELESSGIPVHVTDANLEPLISPKAFSAEDVKEKRRELVVQLEGDISRYQTIQKTNEQVEDDRKPNF